MDELVVRVEEHTIEQFEQLLAGTGVDLPEFFDESEYRVTSVIEETIFQIGNVDAELVPVAYAVPTVGAVFEHNTWIGYTCDSVYSDQLADRIGTVETLIAEAALPTEQAELAEQLQHATFEEAGQMAATVDADELYLVHLSDRLVDTEQAMTEASRQFDGTVRILTAYDTIAL